jgi:hypothetical protein
MGYDDMSYEKCIDCIHMYLDEKTATAYCRLTGNTLKLTHCKHYYGTGEELKHE